MTPSTEFVSAHAISTAEVTHDSGDGATGAGPGGDAGGATGRPGSVCCPRDRTGRRRALDRGSTGVIILVGGDALGMGVDVEIATAHEPEHRQSQLLGKVDCQR